MRVIVTGAGGLLGSAVVREFERHGDVIPLERTTLDVTDAHAVRSALEGERPDAVVNCAAYNQVDAAEDDPRRALEVNAFAPLTLARACAAAGAAFVHYSSDFVFDGETDRPYAEEDRANPQSVYGASKLLGDLLTLGVPGTFVLRVESLFGPAAAGGRRGSLGAIVDGVREGREVPVFTDRTVSPSYTLDVARATRHLLERGAQPGLYHCVNSGSARWSEIAERVAEILGLPLRARHVTLAGLALRARRPRFCALDNRKLAAAGCTMPSWGAALQQFLTD
jgi:dTDP-4-dehydrorhamnose reductase